MESSKVVLAFESVNSKITSSAVISHGTVVLFI